MKKYICSTDAFIFGRRYRAGEVFELPDNVRPGVNMTPVSEETKRKRSPKPKAEPTTLKELGEESANAESKAMFR